MTDSLCVVLGIFIQQEMTGRSIGSVKVYKGVVKCGVEMLDQPIFDRTPAQQRWVYSRIKRLQNLRIHSVLLG